MIQKIWNIKNSLPAQQASLSRALKVHPIIAQLLINREVSAVEQAQDFLASGMEGLHDPFLLKDMDRAVERIRQAQQRKERVMIFGDYDVDGITSTALLYRYLSCIGLDVINHIPHRIKEGYGLNSRSAKDAKKQGVTLLIAVDCGVSAFQEVEDFKAQGIDVIIVDHHEPAEEGVPQAMAVVDPKQRDCPYPFKHLAAVGLAAKLVQALGGTLEEYLDLVALGTIADVVPLRGENRIFVRCGLPLISRTKNQGLKALMEVARLKGKKFRPHYIGFILGPRLNATGRMDSAQKSLDLLLADDPQQALELAEFLESSNLRRQKLQRDVIGDAMALIDRGEVNFKDHKVIVLSKEGWHKGVLGIVASRVAETFYRPAIVISLKDGIGTASARSVEGFHLNEALTHCADSLENFGGHKQAAGLTIREENISRFKDLINDFAKDILQIRNLVPSLDIDYEIPLSSLSLELVYAVDLLEPYGEGNPEPVFCSRQLLVKSRPAVMGKETLKFWVSDGQQTFSAVGFGMAKYKDIVRIGERVDLAYQLSIDDWNKAATVQLRLKDIRACQ